MTAQPRHNTTAETSIGLTSKALVAQIIAALQPEHLLTPPPEGLAVALASPSPITLVAVGKASAGCVRAVLPAIKTHPRSAQTRGLIAAVPEHTDAIASALLHAGLGQIGVLPTDHPAPTERNRVAAIELADLLRDTPREHHVLALISGGGSAQLASPIHPLTLDRLRTLSASLMLAGADIHELNSVRRHLESLKNGGLRRCVPQGIPITAIILADVLPGTSDDPIHGVACTVSSGPFHAGRSEPTDALAVLQRFGLHADFPDAVSLLEHAVRAPGSLDDAHDQPLSTTIAADNATAVNIAADILRAHGIRVTSTRTGVTGDAEQIGRGLARVAIEHAGPCDTPCAIVWGGETTVAVSNPDGRGGPCQHLAVAAAIELDRSPPARPVRVIALGTDGRDGPTHAAGGVIDDATAASAIARGIDLKHALATDNTHPALDTLGLLLVTGPAGTNLNDLMIAIINPPPGAHKP